ncbi:MAG: hypothetical protein WD851_12925 [Pirellulales bacterium]
MHAVQATFRNGQLELMQPVDWPDGTRAEVIPLTYTASPSKESVEGQRSWPVAYFEQTAGALAGEEFERPPQGDLPMRDVW